MSQNHFGSSFVLDKFSLRPALLPVVVGWWARRNKDGNPYSHLRGKDSEITYEVGIGFMPNLLLGKDKATCEAGV